MLMVGAACADQTEHFVAPEFEVPISLKHPDFLIRPLTIKDAVLDFEAVKSSEEHLQKMFLSVWDWPKEALTLAENKQDILRLESSFNKRESFTYTVLSTDSSKVLGAVYINPTKKSDYDAEVSLWVRKSAYDSGLDSTLFAVVKQWLDQQWPFSKIAYPGRTLTWEEWNAIR